MSNTVFELFEQQFREIDKKVESLSDTIRREIPADQQQARLYQLALDWDRANLHYMRAGNKIFDQNNAEIHRLTDELSAAQQELKNALAQLQDIAATLNKITDAVSIAASLFGLGVPAVASPAIRARLRALSFSAPTPAAPGTTLGNAKVVPGRLVGRRIDHRISLFGLIPGAGPSVTTPSGNGRVVSANTVQGAVQRYLGDKLSPDPGIRYGDGSYYLPTIDEVKFILQQSELERRIWTAERFDCDDFSYVLKGEMSAHAYDTGDISFGLCVGMIWGDFDWVSGYHAVNWFVDSDGVLRLIEPQTDAIYDANHCRGNISLLLV